MYARGYAAVGVQEICDQAGVNKGSFYHFFPSKQALVLAVIEAHTQQMQRGWGEVMSARCSLHTRMQTLFEAAYEALRAEQPDVITERLVNALGYELLGGGHTEAAIAVFRLNVEAHPASANVYDSLGEAYMTAGQYEPALKNYKKALELNPNDENGERHVAWIAARLDAATNPVTVPVETLRRYVGDYGPRHVMLEDGTLFYQREGNPRYRLIPMAQNLFALDGLETFRMRFVADDAGRVVKIVGLYLNGNEDETPRDS